VPGVANILSIDLHPNPPQQQQRDSGDDSFSSLLPANSDGTENEKPKVSRREQPARSDKPERPVTTRANKRQAPDHSSQKNAAAQVDTPKSNEPDGIPAKDSATSVDGSADTKPATNDQQASADTSTGSAALVAMPVAPLVDAEVKIAADINLSLALGATASAAQPDGNTNETTTTPVTNVNAVTSTPTPAAGAVTAAPLVETVGTVAASAGAEIAMAVATGKSSPNVGSATIEESAAPIVSSDNPSAAVTSAATSDPAIQIVTAVSTLNPAKKAGGISASTLPTQNETNEADAALSDSTSLDMIASADSKPVADTSKAAITIKVGAQLTPDVSAGKNSTAATETAVTAVNLPGNKGAVVSAEPHLSVKANVESETDFAASTLRLDPALVRYMPSVNPTVLSPQPVTLNPAAGQFQAQAASQPVPLTTAAIAVEIVARAKDGSRQFEIRLDPPEFGRIDVRLDVNKSGEVSTRLTADRQDTLDLLQRDHRGLERALESAGLKTADGEVSFSLRQQTPDGSANDRAQTQNDARPDVLAVEDNEQTTTSIEQYQWAARLRGGVDIRI
jgi:flagellar hook-length control protein FliK